MQTPFVTPPGKILFVFRTSQFPSLGRASLRAWLPTRPRAAITLASLPPTLDPWAGRAFIGGFGVSPKQLSNASAPKHLPAECHGRLCPSCVSFLLPAALTGLPGTVCLGLSPVRAPQGQGLCPLSLVTPAVAWGDALEGPRHALWSTGAR